MECLAGAKLGTQNLDRQIGALRAERCREVFREKASGAENGATEHQLMAIFGWETSEEVERYSKTAKCKKMAGDAMTLLVRPRTEPKFPTSGRKSKR
jgi:hypothetical protein